MPMHCGVANEGVRSLARGHVIRVCIEAVRVTSSGYYGSLI